MKLKNSIVKFIIFVRYWNSKMQGKNVKIWHYNSPCGRLLIGDYQEQMCLCDWDMPGRRELIDGRVARELNAQVVYGKTPLIERVVTQLDEYFKGVRRDFDLPLVMMGTDFQQRVWQELQLVPYGITISYSQLAERIGKPHAVRAVASACRANAMSIIIPCHRVIGYDGAITGYAGGVDAKRFLLKSEAKNSVKS